MTIVRRVRITIWILRDLVFRYKRSLLIGFVVGLFSTLVLGRLAPLFYRTLFRPVERIGVVGTYSLTKLPKPVLADISFGLTTVGSDGKPKPAAAESWEVKDGGKTYLLKLKSLTWHNGKPFVAADVNYNIQGVTFKATGDKTLTVTIPDPFSPFPTLLSKPLLSVGLVGLGPYKVKNIKLKGSSLELIRLQPAQSFRLPEKEYRIYQTENQALLAYKRGDIDSIDDVSDAHEVQGWPQTEVTSRVDHQQILALFFTVKDKESPLVDRSFRQALAFATPDFPKEEEAYSPIPKTSWAYNPDVRKFTHDEAQAKKLLANLKVATDAGELTIMTFPQQADIAKQIADSWTAVGIPSKIRVTNFLDKTFQVFLRVEDVPLDPDQYALWHSDLPDTNLGGYLNLKVDKLLEDGRRELDEEKRKKIYTDFQRYLVEDIPALFLYYPKNYFIQRKP